MARSIFELVFRAVDQGAASAIAALQNALAGVQGVATHAGTAVQSSVSHIGIAVQGASSQTVSAVQHAATATSHAVQQAATSAGHAVQQTAQQAGQAAESMTARFAQLAATIGAMGFLKAAIDEFAGFDDAMLRVQALSGATGDEFEALKAKAAELGASTKFTASEAAAGMSQLAAAGYNTAQILDAIGPAMYAAAAGGSDLGETADQLTNIMGVFCLQADQAGRVADVLTVGFTGAATTMSELAYAMKPAGAIAHALNYSLEETVSVLQSMANVGYKGEVAGTALRNAMAAFLKEGTVEELKKLGVEVRNSEGKIRKFADILEDMGKAGFEAKEMLNFFGDEAGPAMQALLAQGADAIRDYEAKLMQAGGRAKQLGDHMESGIGGALRRLDAAWSALKNSFGEAIAPTVSKVADALGALAGWFAKMPDWAKQALALAAVFGTFSGIIRTAVTFLTTQTTAAVVSMVARIRAAFTLLAAHPVIAAITVALGAAVVAYNMFGKSAIEASREHAAAAEKIGAGIKKQQDKIAELRKLQETLLTTASSTKEHIDAEEKLAKMLPNATIRLDEQGRVLASLSKKTDENNQKLEKFIKLQEGEIRTQQILQLEQLARAYYKADDAQEKYTEDLRAFYGIGKQSQSMLQTLWMEVNKLTGTYDENIQKQGEIADNLDKQRTKYREFLRDMAQSGKSIEEVNAMLSSIHMDDESKKRIVFDYRMMLKNIKDETAEAAKTSADTTKKISAEALEEMKKRWQEYVKQVRDLHDQIAGRQKSLAAELREMGRSGMDDVSAWRDQRREAEEYMAAARRAAEEAKAAFAEGDTITAAAKWKEAVQYADDAKSAYRALNQEVKDGDQTVISKAQALQTAMQGVKSAGELGISVLKEQQETTLQAMKSLEEEAKKGGVADALTEGMDEAEKKWLETFKKMSKAAEETGEQVYKVWKNAAGFWTNVDDAFSAGFSKSADNFTVAWNGAYTSFERAGKDAAAAVSKAIDQAAKDRTATIYVRHVEQRALGGLIGAAGAAMRQLASGGKLPGYGGGDRVSAMLEPGEFVVRKESVRHFGADFFESLNSLKLPDLSSLLPAAMPKPSLAAAGSSSPRTVNINLTLGGDIYQMQTDEHTANRLERWYALRSSNRLTRADYPGLK